MKGVKGVDQLVAVAIPCMGDLFHVYSEYVYIIFAIFVLELCDIYTAIFCIYTVTTLVGA